MNEGFSESCEGEDKPLVHLERLRSEAVWMNHEQPNKNTPEQSPIYKFDPSTWPKEDREQYEALTALLTPEEFDAILELSTIAIEATKDCPEKLKQLLRALSEPSKGSEGSEWLIERLRERREKKKG